MRPPYRPDYGDSDRGRPGPSDEFLAVDAASEERSFRVLYERYADSLFRYFLATTGDLATTDRLLRDLISDLPEHLHQFPAGERSFQGWLFSLASRRFERDSSSLMARLRRTRRAVSRTVTNRGGRSVTELDPDVTRYLSALQHLPSIERQVLVLSAVVGLPATGVSEAIGLPTLAISARLGTGSAALAAKLEGISPADARAFLESALGEVSLSPEQRERHQRLVRPAFGHAEYETQPSGSLARQLSILGVVVVVGLAGLWGWDYVATRLAEEPVEEETTSSADVGNIAADAEDSETPESGSVAGDAPPQSCPADERVALLYQFVDHFNDGEFDALQAMLLESGEGYPTVDEAVLEDSASFASVLPFDPGSFDQGDAVERLRERHDAGEHWEIIDSIAGEDYPEWFGAAPVDLYLDWLDDEPGLGLVMVNEFMTTPDQSFPARGPVIVDCSTEKIVAWGMDWSPEPRVAEPVDVLEFLYATSFLSPSEERIWQVRVMTQDRADDGMMKQWDLEWRQAVDEDGTLLQRGSVYTLGGEEVISFQHDGERWRLEQRGWTRYGTDTDIPLPEEIAQVVPWLNRSSGMIHRNSDAIMPRSTERIVTDSIEFSRSRDVHADIYAAPEAQRSFALDIANGAIVGAHLSEIRADGTEITRPRIYFIDVERSRDVNPDDYRFMYQPRYLDADTRLPRFEMPRDVDQLYVDDTDYETGTNSEQWELRWNDVPLVLTVGPSRGGIDWSALDEEYDELWRSDVGGYRRGAYRWSEGPMSSMNGVPAEALWDNGRYRFELNLGDGADLSGNNWNLRELVALANELSSVGS